ncbi:MAG: hypothetical protein HND47_18390 [Chloroflexi bacterium]|nr:hypothetical protein [Chloroflexota bacterium]
MFRNGFIVRLIGALLLLGLVAAGGYMAYKAGVAQGIAQSPAVAEAIQEGAPISPMYGPAYGHYGYGFGFHPFHPLGAICGSIFFLFLFFGLLRLVFWGRGHHGHWHKGWEGGAPSMFDEWHKRAHGERPAEEKQEEK